MKKWEKLGRVFCPEGSYDWMLTHAANPVAEWLREDLFRVYFSCRDRDRRASIGSVEFDIKNPQKILNISEAPVLQPGQLGLFDDSGVSVACIVTVGKMRYLYYLGWNLGVTVPWRNSIGLAVSESLNSPFVKYSEVPIMDRCSEDPYSISYPYVLKDGEGYKMLYGSNLSWGLGKQEDMAHLIKYAESSDGIHWARNGQVAIGFKSSSEYAMSKPSVIRENGGFKSWFSYRGPSYRIGYAESADCKNWVRRDDQVGIDVSDSGWDSESIEYPNVFDHKGRRYMLYNGNRYGLTGFGLAVQI